HQRPGDRRSRQLVVPPPLGRGRAAGGGRHHPPRDRSGGPARRGPRHARPLRPPRLHPTGTGRRFAVGPTPERIGSMIVPLLDLRTADGAPAPWRDIWQKRNLLLLLADSDCGACKRVLEDWIPHLEEERATAVAIYPEAPPDD